uniref:Uncharacterized protein n=1 Tax=Podoviridae sp. ctG4L18 TaxID=2825234 RepID=A0A8S5UP12_9CAUD|nr:MAG TPA: hypothetical protein [Podoviridae sp. ctG4L18]
MSYLESSLENCHHLSFLAHHLLAPTAIQATSLYYPKHRYLYYFAKLLEIFLAL